MANLCAVVFTGKVPVEVNDLPSVQWYGENAIKTLDKSDMRSIYGENIVMCKHVKSVIDLLISKGINKDKIFWQDLDGYGSNKIFKYRED